MKFKLCKLTFTSPFHVGERENILEKTEVYIHSDTLFSAFCHNYLLLYGSKKLENLLEKFTQGNPPFKISSAFPWWDDKFFFPIPLNQIPKEKELKKITFIEKDGFEKLLLGQPLEEIAKNFQTIPTQKEKSKPWETVNVPRIGLSRLTNHPGENYFHFGEVIYQENSGLFFLIDFKDENFEKEFKATMNLMSQEGIGGDRTVGKGLFKIPEFLDLEFNLPQTLDATITLSLYSPTKEEIPEIRKGYYEIKERSGYIYSPLGRNIRRKSIRMIVEGSVFPGDKKGQLANVTPEIFQDKHKIYRYGLYFSLPCKLEVE